MNIEQILLIIVLMYILFNGYNITERMENKGEKGNENNNLLRSTLDQSRELCKKRYEKPHIRPDDYLSNLRIT